MKVLTDQPLTTKETVPLDEDGSLISGVKFDVLKTYEHIPDLLQKYIDNKDEESWEEITKKIDYIFEGIAVMMNKLNEETNFLYPLKQSVHLGKQLVFKPNLVAPGCIDLITHKEDLNIRLNTPWPMIAALMRWFHDEARIPYGQMALAEGSTSVEFLATLYSKKTGENITNEAVFEGRSGDFYGGWGFYFVRKYLFSHKTDGLNDNPMEGYEESCKGIYLPPGEAKNKLMVYDINKIQDDVSRGRKIKVPGGQNFSNLILHKVLVGGDMMDPEDLERYPGCVLINVPIIKIHAQDLLTNAIKNLGIGLYSNECTDSVNPKDTNWLYAGPNTPLPSFKSKIPHSPWILKTDEVTSLPLKDENGFYSATKTKGFSGTQCDIIKAIQSQGTLMIHIADGINIINLSHNTGSLAKPVPEGFVWASLDCVALDNFCAGYCFNNLPLKKAKEIQEKNKWSTTFIQKVPIPALKHRQIVTTNGFDSPLLRYTLYKDAEKRGIGCCSYHVKGLNLVTNSPLASLDGHLVEKFNNTWIELITTTFYYNPSNILYGLQETILGYAKASDTLSHTNLFNTLMEMLDENQDGIIDYNEKGMGCENSVLGPMANSIEIMVKEDFGTLKAAFLNSTMQLKYSNPTWNKDEHDFLISRLLHDELCCAFILSTDKELKTDLYNPKMSYGNGYWPSFKTAKYVFAMTILYGGISLEHVTLASAYGAALQYCDETTNNGYYTSTENPIERYFNDLQEGIKPLNFSVYVPVGYGRFHGIKIPNVVETKDPELIFTAYFEDSSW